MAVRLISIDGLSARETAFVGPAPLQVAPGIPHHTQYQILELLAIKLFEHDPAIPRDCYGSPNMMWGNLSEEHREHYREVARGETPLYGGRLD